MALQTKDPDFLAFAQYGCPDAFGRLVARHLDSVHSTARRVLGSRGYYAEDVAQQVFIRLATKGRTLPDTIVVGAWLHRQTVRLALNTVRGEVRRSRRESKAAETMNATDHEPNWADVMPHIDRQIDSLGAHDREALALRYQEKCTYGDIATRLGISTAAAEKRVTRALEKLRTRLGRRGFTIAPTALAPWLTQHSAEAAPPALAKSITFAAVSHIPATAPLFALTAMISLKALLAGAALGLLAGGTWASRPQAISPGPTLAAVPTPPKSPLPNSKTPSRWQTPKPGKTAPAIVAQLKQILAEPDNQITRLRLRALLEPLPAGVFAALVAQVEESFTTLEKNRIYPDLVRTWAAIDPESALDSISSPDWKRKRGRAELINEAFATWNSNSPDDAHRWLIENQENPNFSKMVPAMISIVATGLLQFSDETVIEWATQLEGTEYRRAALAPLWEQYTRLEDEDGADRSAELSRLFEQVEDMEDRDLALFAASEMGKDWAKYRFAEFGKWLALQKPGTLAYAAAAKTASLAKDFDSQKEILEQAWRLAGDADPSKTVSQLIQNITYIHPELLDWALPHLATDERDDAIVHVFTTNRAPWSYWSSRNPPPEIGLKWGSPAFSGDLVPGLQGGRGPGF